jgi:hypothetical protein
MNPIRFFTTSILFFSFSILIAQDPPANNTYQTATELSVQTDFCSTQTQGDLTYATDSGVIASEDCGYDLVFTYVDVWYKAIVPGSGKLTFETSAVSGSVLVDTIIVAYTLSEDTLTEISCNDDISPAGNNYFSKVELSGQAENTVIYIMVLDYNNANYSSETSLGPFNICAFDPEASLDFPQAQKPLLSYYSNPVGNRLEIESPYQIQTLRVFDLMGKEVLHKTPNQQKLTLNTFTLAPGAYLLHVETAEGVQMVKLVKE